MLESDRYQPTPYIKIKHPEWSKNAIIYQINTRQFTAEGTLYIGSLYNKPRHHAADQPHGLRSSSEYRSGRCGPASAKKSK
jgi:hypothetical protein